ncbi:MAG TPA: acetyl-CoA carboxylase biotin carboxyl carrier protein subunit [Prolixibacteraceae bacterium]|nr:acetyl-CoA carboxylase biotin carboxyl carrier protein subunit [Prolixibacteraceae bacterium]
MPYKIKIKNRIEKIEILNQNDTLYQVNIGDKTYLFDVVKVENGVYSVLYNGKSTNMEMIEADKPNKYIVNTRNNDYQIEIIDVKSHYREISDGALNKDDTIILSPMPGKIVKIPVKQGDKVEKGETLIVVSAMKMESEYKSPANGIVSKIFVKEGVNINGNQPLIEIELINQN